MGLPIVFLVGLLVVFGAREFETPIAGSGEFGQLGIAATGLAVPILLVLAARYLVRRRIAEGRRTGRLPSILLRLSMSTLPLAALLFCTYGGWTDFAWRWSSDSNFVSLVLLVLPLVVVEVPRIVLATQAGIWIEIGQHVDRSAGLEKAPLPRLSELLPVIRLHLGWIVLITLPWTMLGLGLDILALSRDVYTFVLGTSIGLTIGFLALLLVAAVTLPAWFRIAFGTNSNLPEPLGSDLRHTAATMGFPPSRVLLLPTGMSAVNAMMVGPLPASRCLVLTDGLLRMLDSEALSGVVAHEVGHAHKGHPGLLMLLAVVLPLLLLQPVSLLRLDDLDVVWQVAAGVGAVGLTWFLVRSLAQRFELEADVASVQALGAEPCSRALRAVMHGATSSRRSLLGRLMSLHPDEQTRLATMRRYEEEPPFRQRFDATGRKLRAGILTAVAAGLAVAAWVWVEDWPYERAIWRFQSGDVAAATRLMSEQRAAVPDHWRETWELFATELDAAMAIAPNATDWATARAAFDSQAFDRGVEVLVRSGPAAAGAWFALAVESDGPDWLLRQQLYELSRAARDGDTELVEAIRSIVRRRDIPAVLATAF